MNNTSDPSAGATVAHNARNTNEDTAAMGKDATRKLARHAATIEYEALPPALVTLMKQCVLDTLGVAIAASTLAPESRIVADYVMDLGGKPESTVLGFGGKAPAPWAVFVNGTLGHVLDYDTIGEGGHVAVVTVPVAFALAEKSGGTTGQQLIAAVAAGTDIHTRLSQSIDIPDWSQAEGWLATQLLGYVSGAATAGRLMKLNEKQMENALGIAFNQLSGSRQMGVGVATDMRAMQAGFSGQGAILAAQLAQRGLTGPKKMIEGRHGLFRNYVRTDKPNWDALVGKLGTRFPLLATNGFKVWPCCGDIRPSNTAIMQMRHEHKLRPEDIESIVVIGGSGGTKLLSEPIETKRRPKTSIDAKYSIPFTTAVMMAKGNVRLRDYTDEGLHDPATLAMADRVSYRAAPETAKKFSGKIPWSGVGLVAVEIRTKDGRVFRRQPDSVPGDPKSPVSQKLLEEKFRDCVSFSAKPVPRRNIDRVIEMIRDLENVVDATEIIRLLA